MMSSSRFTLRGYVAGFLFLVMYASSARAGLFNHIVNDATTPDATLRITFPYSTSLGFEPASLRIEAIYKASNPSEEGVQTITHKTRNCPKIPIPFGLGCQTQKSTTAVEVPLTVKPEWLTVTKLNAFEIKLSEHLRGPGNYRLTKIRFVCPDVLCRGRKPINEWEIGFDDGVRIDNLPPFMRLGVDEASTFTAAFEGKTLQIQRTIGSHSAEGIMTQSGTQSLLHAVQDEQGQWHISSNAFTLKVETSCSEPFMPSTKNLIDAKNYLGLAWALPFKKFAFGEVYDTIVWEIAPDGSQLVGRHVKPTEWSGCIALMAEGLENHNDDYEVRRYVFVKGQLRSRRISRFVLGDSMDQYVELDAGNRLLFFREETYSNKTREHSGVSWNRLLYEAYPKDSPPQPPFELKDVLTEADEVLTIITPHFP